MVAATARATPGEEPTLRRRHFVPVPRVESRVLKKARPSGRMGLVAGA